jgi:hypothetical protein
MWLWPTDPIDLSASMQRRAEVIPLSRSTARCRRRVFQAMTQLVTRVSAPEVAISSSARRPRRTAAARSLMPAGIGILRANGPWWESGRFRVLAAGNDVPARSEKGAGGTANQRLTAHVRAGKRGTKISQHAEWTTLSWVGLTP